MKKFLKYISIIFIITVLTAFLLEYIYSTSFRNSIPRNKTRYILTLTEKDTFDFVFLGSSRVENFIVTQEIEKQTKKRALNLGTQGAKLDDIYLYLLLLKNQNVVMKNVFIQLDYIYNFESNSVNIRSQMLPYLNHNEVFDNYLKHRDSNYFYLKNIPFYKYAINDYSIGFREVFNNLRNKKTKMDFSDGFVPVFGYDSKSKMKLPGKILERNKSFEEIITFCKRNNINIRFYCAPFSSKVSNKKYLNDLSLKVENFINFSNVIKDDTKFKNCSHVNESGAHEFTQIFMDSLLLKK